MMLRLIHSFIHRRLRQYDLLRRLPNRNILGRRTTVSPMTVNCHHTPTRRL